MAGSGGSSKRTSVRSSADAARRAEADELPWAGLRPGPNEHMPAGFSVSGLRGLIWSLFLALAFWCLAIVFYISLQQDPNRVLYALMAALLALLWTGNFSLRLSRFRGRPH